MYHNLCLSSGSHQLDHLNRIPSTVLSQNELGRFIAMDAANIKGVIDRLKRLNLVRTRTDPNDARRHLIYLTPLGKVVIERSIPKASLITEKTLSPLSKEEQIIFLTLLKKISSPD